jgi:hypothetical protein
LTHGPDIKWLGRHDIPETMIGGWHNAAKGHAVPESLQAVRGLDQHAVDPKNTPQGHGIT